MLNRHGNSNRVRKACSLQNAKKVGLIYKERDSSFHRVVKDLAKHLRDELGVRRVAIFSYVDVDAKKTPSYLVKKLDSGFFCKSDLNWYGKPVSEIESFVNVEFDILIDLELEPVLPLKHILKMSKAHMKVGPSQEGFNSTEYDVIIQPNNTGEKDPMLVWKEHTERTFQFISEVNFQ